MEFGVGHFRKLITRKWRKRDDLKRLKMFRHAWEHNCKEKERKKRCSKSFTPKEESTRCDMLQLATWELWVANLAKKKKKRLCPISVKSDFLNFLKKLTQPRPTQEKKASHETKFHLSEIKFFSCFLKKLSLKNEYILIAVLLQLQ